MNNEVYVSIMAQYFPTYKALEDDKINRKLTLKEYRTLEEYVYMLDLKNGYLQDLEENEEQYVPEW